MEKYDIIVVGAGPAGATAAERCAQKGLRTLILDKFRLPRYKPCGGGITKKALALLNNSLPNDLVEGECFNVQIKHGSSNITIARKTPQITLISRQKFDYHLVCKAIEAGSDLIDENAVIAVAVLDSCVRIKCKSGTFQCDLVIGADGANSFIAKSVREPFKRNQIGLACDLLLDNGEFEFISKDTALFDFGVITNGYGWIFPRHDYFGVGIGVRGPDFKLLNEKLAFTLENWGIKRTRHKAHWHLLPIGGYPRRIISDRIILVGDAAGFVEPMFGGGIEFAIQSSIYAAQTAHEAIKTGDFTEKTLSKYVISCSRSFGNSFKLLRYLTYYVYRYPSLLVSYYRIINPLYNFSFQK